MNTLKLVPLMLLVPLGVFLFIYGGYDDSPGAQGLGVLVAISGIVGIVRSRKKAYR